MIILDFETFCKVSIDAGAYRYSQYAEVLCLSYSLDGGKTITSWRQGGPQPVKLFAAIALGEDVHAHNAMFEMNIWRNVCVAKMGWPPVPQEQWRCTMAECLSANLPGSLEKTGEALDTPIKKNMEGRRLMLKLCKPRKPTKKDASTRHTKPDEIEAVCRYCDDDVLSEAAIHDMVPRLTPAELKTYQFCISVNDKGVKIDRELVNSAIDIWGQHRNAQWAELSDRTFDMVPTTDAVKNMRKCLGLLGCDTPNLTKETVEELLKQGSLSPTAKYILQMRQDLALTSIAKYEKMALCAEADDRIRGCFQYHGASQTGRWAGRLVQFQNLPRGGVDQNEIERCISLVKSRDYTKVLAESPLEVGDLLSSLLRSAIVADEGKILRVSDFAGVEARALAWAAQENWLLDAFRDGADIYKTMASGIYGVPVESVSKAQRFVGKEAILGCGYGMGGLKFRATLAKKGVEVDLDFAKDVVDTYRKKNSEIRSFWYAMERAAIGAVRSPATTYAAGPFRFFMDGKWLCNKLPSGRCIKYYRAHLIDGEYGKKIAYKGLDKNSNVCWADTYAGKLTENAIQAMCRDLLVYAMSTLHKAGYNIVGHVHDEIITEDPEDFGSIHEVEQLMCKLPSWAAGFPIGVEGFEAKRYRK